MTIKNKTILTSIIAITVLSMGLSTAFAQEGRPGTIGDTVFHDENNNGLHDADELGIPGVTVNVTCTLPDDAVFTDTESTDANGNYLFTDIPIDLACIVTTDPSTAPIDVELGDNCPGSYAIDLFSGESFLDADFCLKPINSPPMAVDDDADTLKDIPIEIDVLVNDSDPDEDSLVIDSIESVPSNGVVEISLDNLSMTYTPNLGFTGLDSFDYTISDGNGGSATATVNVDVLTPEEGIGNLKDKVDELGLPQGPLTNILQLLTDNNPNNDVAACGMLTGFITNVEGFIANGDIISQEGQALIDAAEDIKTSLGIC